MWKKVHLASLHFESACDQIALLIESTSLNSIKSFSELLDWNTGLVINNKHQLNPLIFFMENHLRKQSGCGLREKFGPGYVKETGLINRLFHILHGGIHSKARRKWWLDRKTLVEIQLNLPRNTTVLGNYGQIFVRFGTEMAVIIFKVFTLVS